jgi:hypothetical protein
VRDRADLVVGLVTKELPWIRWLPQAEQTQCVEELIG